MQSWLIIAALFAVGAIVGFLRRRTATTQFQTLANALGGTVVGRFWVRAMEVPRAESLLRYEFCSVQQGENSSVQQTRFSVSLPLRRATKLCFMIHGGWDSARADRWSRLVAGQTANAMVARQFGTSVPTAETALEGHYAAFSDRPALAQAFAEGARDALLDVRAPSWILMPGKSGAAPGEHTLAATYPGEVWDVAVAQGALRALEVAASALREADARSEEAAASEPPPTAPPGRFGCVGSLGLFFALLATVFFVATGSTLAAYTLANLRWTAATATIVTSQVDESSNGDDGHTYRPKATYRYSVDGESHESDAYGIGMERGATGTGDPSDAQAWVDAHPAGSPVVVHYDPEDPERAALDLRPNAIVTLFALFPVAHFLVGLSMVATARVGPIRARLGDRKRLVAAAVWGVLVFALDVGLHALGLVAGGILLAYFLVLAAAAPFCEFRFGPMKRSGG